MTLPDERYRAVVRTEKFLMALCNPTETPRVPKDIRQQARALLRHYPNTWDMNRAAQATPDVFAENMEAVTRLFKQYEVSKAEKNES